MKNNYSFLAIVFLFLAVQLHAQVAIGVKEPNKDAALEIYSESKGLLLPRIALESLDSPNPLTSHVAGMVVYNTAVSTTSEQYVSPGFYYNTGEKWERLYLGYNNWFYMPSIAFETGVTLTGQTKDLYTLYKKQFDGTGANFSKSTGAPSIIPHIPSSDQLYYYVTDLDSDVFSNVEIDANGVMTYDVTAAATDFTYINIVFVLK